MNYNPLIDLGLLALFIGILCAMCWRLEPDSPRGATRASRKEIRRHQAERNVLMKERAR